MKKLREQPSQAMPGPPPLPGWIARAAAEPLDASAFRSGAALAHLALVAAADVPLPLWRDRLALAAAETCAAMAGRREGQGALRDALHLTRAGDDPGPAGRVLRQWSRAVARPVSVAGLGRVLEGIAPEQIGLCLDAAGPTPVDRAAAVIEAVLADVPRAETAALILADAVLAQGWGQDHAVPLLSLAIKPRDLRLRGDDLRLACHRAVAAGAAQAVSLATELSRAAARLRAVTPKLRAKGATRAVDLFLSRDAVAPGALTFMSDRAARRLCDRLVSLGAVRELTGRDTFRPYELAQVGAGWMLRTRAAYGPAIRAAADVGGQSLNLSEFDIAVLAAIAYHQPISRDGLKDIFGKEISRDLIGRLADRDLIGTGPREPRRGAPYTFVTTETFLASFGLESLRDLPDPEQLDDAGLAAP